MTLRKPHLCVSAFPDGGMRYTNLTHETLSFVMRGLDIHLGVIAVATEGERRVVCVANTCCPSSFYHVEMLSRPSGVVENIGADEKQLAHSGESFDKTFGVVEVRDAELHTEGLKNCTILVVGRGSDYGRSSWAVLDEMVKDESTKTPSDSGNEIVDHSVESRL